MPYKDPEKMRAARRKSYEKNKAKYHQTAVERKTHWLAMVRSAKSVPCVDCNQSYPYYVMQFDHVRGEKVDSISRLISCRRYHLVKEEIAKCEVVCANCHASRTFSRMVSTEEEASSLLD